MSSFIDIDVNDFYTEVLEACESTLNASVEVLTQEIYDAADDAVRHLKADVGEWSQTEDLPERERLTYEKGWKAYKHKMVDGHVQAVVANMTAPGLTHLVEKSHRLFVYGRDTGRMTKARPHIANAYEYARSRHFSGGDA